jgi:hypothetical protein
MEITKNQKIVGISLMGVIVWLLYRKKVKLQSQRVETPSGPAQVVVPVATGPGTGPIANVLGNVIPTAHAELVNKALSQIPVVIQGNKAAPTRVSTVADIQHALSFLKVCSVPLKDSGVMDPPTVACIKAFQSIMQIPITGMDDPTTKMALESAVTKAGISVNAPAVLAHPSVVAPPHVNPIIQTERDLQRNLNLLGASPKLKEDGKIGPVTTAAIKAFQVVHGLLADGLAGPKTKAAIATAAQGGGSPAIPSVAHPAAPAMTAAGDFGGFSFFPVPASTIPAPPVPAPPVPAPPSFPYHPAPPVLHHHHPAPPVTHPAMPGWLDPQAGQFFSGDFGAGRVGMRSGGSFRSRSGRGRSWVLGLPYDEDTDVDIVEVVDEYGVPVMINGEQLEAGAMWEARHSFEEARARGDRRFEHPSIGPEAPPLPGENYRAEHHWPHREEYHHHNRWGWGDRIREWFGWGHRRNIDENQFIPQPATPPVVNWDPFSVVEVVDTVERWHPDDLRRREELEHRGYAPRPPIEPGRPAAPVVDHATPPAPPPQRPGAPPAAPPPPAPHPAAPPPRI